MWEKRMVRDKKGQMHIHIVCWSVQLSDYALCLNISVCPTFLLNSYLTLSWVSDTLFCVHGGEYINTHKQFTKQFTYVAIYIQMYTEILHRMNVFELLFYTASCM